MKTARYAPVGLAVLVAACGGRSEPRRTVFDPATMGASGPAILPVAETSGLEEPFPALDGRRGTPSADWIGVSVLRGGVRLSRPRRWMLRDAGIDAGRAFITYVSPAAYSFAIYERSDAPTDLWRDVLGRYENDVVASGAKLAGRRIAMATPANQGRGYTIERTAPVHSRSREYLLRSSHRIVLVQVVTEDADLHRLAGEILAVLDSLEVL